MLPLSYTISFDLRKSLDNIDGLRQKILLTPIPRKSEQQIQWDALIKKLRYTFLLKGHDFSTATIIKLIAHGSKPIDNRAQQELIFYRRALNYISEEWIANPTLISVRIIRGLSNMISFNPEKNSAHFKKAEPALQHLLEYLQTRPDHPILLAAIAYIKILDINPTVQNNDLLAQLTANLFMYKYGFDVKEFMSFEEYLYKNLHTFKSVLDEAMTKGRLTLWLEYFSFTIEHQLTKVAQHLASPTAQKDSINRIWRLTDRQKDILHKLEEPGANITNRSVQKMFGISQITASRDLAKLARLGLLLTHGKGRSVYYIKS